MGCLRPHGIAPTVAFFSSMNFQSAEVLPQGVAYQGGAIPLRPPCGLVGGLQKLLVEDNLDGFHIVEFAPHYTPHPSAGLNF